MAGKRIEGRYTRTPSGNPSATITRPDNATQYAAGDVVGTNPATNITFNNVMPMVDAHFYIVGVKLEIVKNAVPANMSSFTLHLFDAAPTAIVDNSAWALLAADASKYLGSIDINLPEDLGETLISFKDEVNMKRKLISSSQAIYGQLVTNGNYTPASYDVANIELQVIGA